MNAIDINILIYAHDPRDPIKRTAALSLINSLSDGALLWQVACEFLWASRKLEPLGYDRDHAWNEVRRLRFTWTTIHPDWDVMDRAEQLLTDYSLSFWDSMIVAACLEGGVRCLYSENFNGYSHIEGLLLINPFKTP